MVDVTPIGTALRRALRFGLVVAALALAPTAGAQEAKPTTSPSPPGAAVYFIDLKDGATVPETFVVHFGLRGMGVAPAGSDRPNAGHHHLLIDTDLPPLDEPIPNDFNHLHFGAGQTEAEVTLPPGEHTLQLLLGDRNHVPHTPPVVSERIKIKVVAVGTALPAAGTAATPPVAAPPPAAAPAGTAAYVRKPSPPGAKVYFVYPTNNAVVPRTTTIRFGLIGMGVAPAGFDKTNTGHHHLLIDSELPPFDEPIPNDFNHIHFGLGQTEAKVTLPLGPHVLQLLLADANHVPHDPPVFSKPIRVLVTATGRRPKVGRRTRTRLNRE